MRDNTPRPMIPSVSPLIRAAPDATSRICSTLWTRVPSRRAWCSQVVRRYRFRMWHMVESAVSSTEAAGMLQTAIPAGVERFRSGSSCSKHILLCIVWDVMENLLNHYLSLQQTLCRYYQSRSQCGQLYEVLWTFPGPPSSGWWCGTWEHPLLHLIPERVDTKLRSVCAKKMVTSITTLKYSESKIPEPSTWHKTQNIFITGHDLKGQFTQK